jgi:hypothetical protein
MDEETVGIVLLMDSIPVGYGSIPQAPAMILKGVKLSMGVDLIGKREIGLKDNETGKGQE